MWIVKHWRIYEKYTQIDDSSNEILDNFNAYTFLMATQKILFRKNPLKMFACCCRCQCWNVRRSPTWNGFILAYDDFIFKRTKVVSQHECMGWRAFNIARVCVSRIFDVWCRFVPSSPPTFWTFFRSMLMAIWTLELSIQFFFGESH